MKEINLEIIKKIGGDKVIEMELERQKKRQNEAAVDEYIQRIHDGLKDIPFHREVIKKDELVKVLLLRDFLNNFKKENKPNLKSVEILEEKLDNMDLWVSKFSTMLRSIDSEAPLVENPKGDSVYYTTSSGISLRLRKISLEEGLGLQGVIQPFAERIFYVSDNEASLKPKIGFATREFFTREFDEILEKQNINSDFDSKIKIYEKDEKIFGIVMPEGDNAAPHEGDRINKIYFERS